MIKSEPISSLKQHQPQHMTINGNQTFAPYNADEDSPIVHIMDRSIG